MITQILNQRVEIINLLIQNGADVNQSSSYGTPLLAATRNKMMKLMEVLLLNGANPNSKCVSNNYTPLHFLCSPMSSMHESLWEEDIKMIDLLITYGACE